jgi:hypothetical protein
VVVAMAARQDVLSALKGGPAAVLAGALAVGLGFLLVPVIVRLGAPRGQSEDESQPGDDR